MNFTADMQILEFDSFETAFPVQPGKEDDAKRRFMTLFAQSDETAQVGGTSYVCKAQSFTGETFAVKRLLTSAGIPKDANLTPEDTARITQGHAAAFYEEYKNQLLVSRMRGFPRLYGYGMIGGDPAIVMEWVEGISLRDLYREYSSEGRPLPTSMIAAIGASVLEVLLSVTRLDNTLVHRDISPANILIRTDDESVDEQAEKMAFDVCLIDFGSASAHAPQEASFTMASQVWRNGTPEYAPPEMLTQDIAHIDELRKSQAIDVFALCSVLYELYAGHTPWRVGEHPELSPFRIKTERAAETVALRENADKPFIDAIMGGLAADQVQRPDVKRLLVELREFAPEVPEGGAAVEGASASAGALQGAPQARGRDWLPSLYTPDSTHLKVAAAGEGGKRAGEEVPPFTRQPKLLTRRSVIVGGLVLAAAAVGGALAARSCGMEQAVDYSAYPVTGEVYEGGPYYPAMRMNDSAWILRSGESGVEIPVGSGSREPGRLVDGLLRAYDPASGYYGFMTVVDGGDSGPACAWRTLPKYEDVGDFSALDDGGSAGQMERLAAAKDPSSGLWGYIDASGDVKIQHEFASARRFCNGVAAVRKPGEALWGLVDRSGAYVVAAGFSALGVCSDEDLMAASGPSGGAWGFIDASGSWSIPEAYARVRRFSEGRAACLFDEDGLWGYIDQEGHVVIEGRFADAFPFVDGCAPAQDADSKLWGLIDLEGSWQVEPRYLSIGEKVGGLYPAHGSPANVYEIEGKDKKAWREYTLDNSDWSFGYGYVDAGGDWAVKPIYGDTLIRQPEQ